MSKAVAVKEEAALPALVDPQARGNIDSSDIALPRLYKGEYQSALVQTDVVPKGSIFVASGPDDPDPDVLAEKVGDRVTVHVLRMWKAKSANIDDAGNVVKSGGTFTTYGWDDPTAPEGANKDFHYVVMLPDVDTTVPVKLTLSKTSVPAGRNMNFLLLKDPNQPLHNLAFELNTKAREKTSGGDKYRWFVWEARLVEAKPENVEAAAALSVLVNAEPARNNIDATSGPGNEPAI